MADDKVASFGIRIPVDSPGALPAANAVDALRQQIEGSQSAIRNYQSSLRGLRGTSNEVVAAKAQLKNALTAERDSVSRNTLELGRHGKTLLEVQTAHKQTAAALVETKSGFEAARGPVAEFGEKIQSTTGLLEAMGSGTGLVIGGLSALAVVVVATTAAVAKLTYATGEYLLVQGDLRRTMNLDREASAGSALNASRLGDHIDDLRHKTSLSYAELQKFGTGVTTALQGTRVSGQGMVDTFNAIAQASGALGDSAGGKIQSIVDRAKTYGRGGIGRFELQGLGGGFAQTDVAASLAKRLNIGMRQAQIALMSGRVKVDDLAGALNDSLTKKFGKLNLDKAGGLASSVQRFKDNLGGLAATVDISGPLKDFGRLADLFDINTANGRVLAGFLKTFGALVKEPFHEATIGVESFILHFENYALRFELAGINMAIYAKEKFGVSLKGAFDGATIGADLAKVAFVGIAGALIVTGVAVAVLVKNFERMADALSLVVKYYRSVNELGASMGGAVRKALDFAGITTPAKPPLMQPGVEANVSAPYVQRLPVQTGQDVGAGFSLGLANATPGAAANAAKMGDAAYAALAASLQVKSPSRRAMYVGQMVGAGLAGGSDAGVPHVERAASRLGDAAVPSISLRGGGVGGGSGASGGAKVEVHAHFPNAKSGADVSAALTGAGFAAELAKALDSIARTAGVPTTVT